MDNKEWSDIIVKCAEDYTKLKSMDKVETPPRDFIRAWMQINYSIFKLSGHFFRMFNSVLRKKYDEGTISESFVRKTSKTDKDSILDNGFVGISVKDVERFIDRHTEAFDRWAKHPKNFKEGVDNVKINKGEKRPVFFGTIEDKIRCYKNIFDEVRDLFLDECCDYDDSGNKILLKEVLSSSDNYVYLRAVRLFKGLDGEEPVVEFECQTQYGDKFISRCLCGGVPVNFSCYWSQLSTKAKMEIMLTFHTELEGIEESFTRFKTKRKNLNESFTKKISKKQVSDLTPESVFVPNGVYIYHDKLGVCEIESWDTSNNEGVVGVLVVEDDVKFIMAMEDSEDYYIWSKENKLVYDDNYDVSLDSASKDMEGLRNCRKLNDPSFPAAYYCHTYNRGGRSWYLPSIGELLLICKWMGAIQTALKIIGGDCFRLDDFNDCYYWSSTEMDYKSAGIVNLSNEMSGAVKKTLTKAKVRPFSKFSFNEIKESFTKKTVSKKTAKNILKRADGFLYQIGDVFPKKGENVQGVVVADSESLQRNGILIMSPTFIDNLGKPTSNKGFRTKNSVIKAIELYNKRNGGGWHLLTREEGLAMGLMENTWEIPWEKQKKVFSNHRNKISSTLKKLGYSNEEIYGTNMLIMDRGSFNMGGWEMNDYNSGNMLRLFKFIDFSNLSESFIKKTSGRKSGSLVAKANDLASDIEDVETFVKFLDSYFSENAESLKAKAKPKELIFNYSYQYKNESRADDWKRHLFEFSFDTIKKKISKKTGNVEKEFISRFTIYICNSMRYKDSFVFEVDCERPWSFKNPPLDSRYESFYFVGQVEVNDPRHERFIIPVTVSKSSMAWKPTLRNAMLFRDMILMIIDNFTEIGKMKDQYPNTKITNAYQESFNEIKDNVYNVSPSSIYR